MRRLMLSLLIAATLHPTADAADAGKDAAPAAPRPPSPGASHQPRELLWGYEGEKGPVKWAEIDPKYRACGSGKRQSPINIETRDVEKAALKPIHFDYRAGPAELVNTGHTIQVNLPDSGSARFDNLEHKLVQFHFHTPSEERIDGMAQQMVAHLVHRAGDTRFAVVAVLIKLGKENKALRPVFENLPQRESLRATIPALNPAELLPADPTYFSYVGSLTTPPCTEEVKWYVMKTPVEVSYRQFAAFKALYKNNSRPVQSLNGRRVQVYQQP